MSQLVPVAPNNRNGQFGGPDQGEGAPYRVYPATATSAFTPSSGQTHTVRVGGKAPLMFPTPRPSTDQHSAWKNTIDYLEELAEWCDLQSLVPTTDGKKPLQLNPYVLTHCVKKAQAAHSAWKKAEMVGSLIQEGTPESMAALQAFHARQQKEQERKAKERHIWQETNAKLREARPPSEWVKRPREADDAAA